MLIVTSQMSVLLFIVILALLILVHELGHFLAAKKAGVRVDEFGIGFPPRIFQKKIGETVYSINAFPVGGFVKIFGEDPNSETTIGVDAERSIARKPRLVQAWIISAGVIFNLLFAWFLISVGFMIGLPYSADSDSKYSSRIEDPRLTITSVLPLSPAESAGLSGGDVITKITSGKDLVNSPDVSAAQNFIGSHEEVEITVLRGEEMKKVMVDGAEGFVNGRRAIGVSLDSVGTLKLPLHEAVVMGFTTTVFLTHAMTVGILEFFKNVFIGQGSLAGIAGPVGIVGIVHDASSLGFVHVLTLTAIISINLAIINLLPFPALDGGRLLFLGIEAIKRSPIKPSIVNTVNAIGFLVLIAFMVFVTFHDVVRLMQG